jgi:DNA-binding transcriptional LysR family regulator
MLCWTSRRTFQIASTDNLELLLLPPLSRLLRPEAPGVDIRISPLLDNWRSSLRAGDFDLKLGRDYDPGPGLLSQNLLRERFVGAVREGHPLKARRISLERYATLLHIRIAPAPDVHDTSPDLIDKQLLAYGLTRRVVVTVPHFLVAPVILASSDLLLTAPERLIEAFRRPLRLRTVIPALPEVGYTFSQVRSESVDGDAGLRWLRGGIRRSPAGV